MDAGNRAVESCTRVHFCIGVLVPLKLPMCFVCTYRGEYFRTIYFSIPLRNLFTHDCFVNCSIQSSPWCPGELEITLSTAPRWCNYKKQLVLEGQSTHN